MLGPYVLLSWKETRNTKEHKYQPSAGGELPVAWFPRGDGQMQTCPSGRWGSNKLLFLTCLSSQMPLSFEQDVEQLLSSEWFDSTRSQKKTSVSKVVKNITTFCIASPLCSRWVGRGKLYFPFSTVFIFKKRVWGEGERFNCPLIVPQSPIKKLWT